MFRLLAGLFLILAAGVLAVDLWPLVTGSGAFRLSALGEWWAWAHQTSLIGLNSTVEKRLGPVVWDAVFQPLLEWPLAVELAVLAAVCWLLRARTPRAGRRRRDLDLTRK